jgi:CTP:phosphocholine cytidylyltransferase-like protein
MLDWEFIEELSEDWLKNKSADELVKICSEYSLALKKSKSLWLRYFIAKISLLKMKLGEKGQPVIGYEKELKKYKERGMRYDGKIRDR